jgi:hypothetical protein
MSSSNAPSYYFDNIDFNSSFFTASSSSSGLSQSTADARYLKKITSDTATLLETFSGGLVVSNGLSADFIYPSNVANSPGQIGWTQSFASGSITSKSFGTIIGANILWSYDTNGITTGTQLPVGIYLMTISGTCTIPSGITAGTIVTYATGWATGSTYSGSMTRNALIFSTDANYGVMTKTPGVYPYSASSVVKNLVTNTYIAGYLLVNFTTALTGGTYTLAITSYSLTRIG